MEQTTVVDMQGKTFEAGHGIDFKILDDKILISTKSETSLELKEGNFHLKGDQLIIKAGHGIKISSVHPNVLVITADTTKQDEKIFDMKKQMDERLKNIEAIFVKIVKANK